MEQALTLEVHAARAALYLAIAQILDGNLSPIELATLRVTLGASEPPSALALAWETIRHVVDRMEQGAKIAAAHQHAREWSRNLRALALCTDERREALLRGERGANGGRCGRAETDNAARRLSAAAEALAEADGLCVSIGRALGWILRDDPHLTEAEAQDASARDQTHPAVIPSAGPGAHPVKPSDAQSIRSTRPA